MIGLPINTLCWQNAELLIVRAGGTYLLLGFRGLEKYLYSYPKFSECTIVVYII
jgi:hypothetical protein